MKYSILVQLDYRQIIGSFSKRLFPLRKKLQNTPDEPDALDADVVFARPWGG
jgi:hypothetical protein